MSVALRALRVFGGLTTVVVLATACSSGSGTENAAPAASDTAAAVSSAPATAVRHLDPAAFATAIGQPGVVLLDVRTPAEYAAGHLAKATNLDMQAADFPARIAKLDKAAGYALYCRTGHRSGVAAEQMRAAGFTNVLDLAGGITAWGAAGKPVTTG